MGKGFHKHNKMMKRIIDNDSWCDEVSSILSKPFTSLKKKLPSEKIYFDFVFKEKLKKIE